MLSFFWIVFILTLVCALAWPMGRYMDWAMNPPATVGRLRARLRAWCTTLYGPLLDEQQDWKKYGWSLAMFNFAMFVVVFIVLALQSRLPLNPDQRTFLRLDLIFHTVASFVANTNQQHYSGEVSLSYFSQLFGLMWLQFVSAATGIAALTALARGLAGHVHLGNFYRDLLRALLLVLLPLAAVLAVVLALSGVPMTFKGAATVHTLEGVVQTIARGPVAAFVAIKQLGTNGGGYFGANGSHPFENPTLFSNVVETIAILLLPMACVWLYGRITGRQRHALVIFSVMLFLLIAKLGLAEYFENRPAAASPGIAETTFIGNLEGKELRFGPEASTLWTVFTTASSNGSVNGMIASMYPITVLIALVGMWLNVAFGGVGVGMINMFLYIIVGVFICGMMVGRTPEYFSRKVEIHEMKLALPALLLHPFLILGGAALFSATLWGSSTTLNPGSRGFVEILYEFTSAAANNGSGLEGLNDNTVAWNVATGLVMLLGRFLPILLPLAMAGSLAKKKPTPETVGTLHTDTVLFGFVMLGSVLFIGALLFMPVAVLGPIAEHLTVVKF
jgi:potassium-transporting ATPase potassium-binding subunit